MQALGKRRCRFISAAQQRHHPAYNVPMRRVLCLLLLTVLTLAIGCATAANVDLGRLKLPPGFHISIFSDTTQHPRLMTFSPGGVLLATAMTDGTVLAFPDPQHAGRAARIATVLSDLDAP